MTEHMSVEEYKQQLRAMEEKQFMQSILMLATMNGWLAYHTYDSRRSAPGFPDLVLVKPPRLVFLETKREQGKLTQAQAQWIEALHNVTGRPESYVLRPSDWDLACDVLSSTGKTTNG